MFALPKKRVLTIFSISVLLILLYSSADSPLGIKFRPEIYSSERTPNQIELPAVPVTDTQLPDTRDDSSNASSPANSSTPTPVPSSPAPSVSNQSTSTSCRPSLSGAAVTKTQRQITYSYNTKKRRKEKENRRFT